MAEDSAWRGRVIDGRYDIEGVLGEGGMGVVLRARQRFTGAIVAVKVLREELSRDLQIQRRFLTEARASNAIAHPGIVTVLDAGRDPTGALYVAMELLVGQSLRAAMSTGALRAADVIRVARELLEVLGAAHARGFVHRDLKPENIFLVAPSGGVKLLDFGIAKVISGRQTLGVATAAGAVLGTVAYMAPEQLDDASAVDARADLWSVAIMVYEMLAGRLPYDAVTQQELFCSVAATEIVPIRVPLPAADPPLDALFARALARDPAARFPSAEALAQALGQLQLGAVAVVAGRPPPPAPSVVASAYDAPPVQRAVPPPARGTGRWWRIAGGVAVVVVAAIATGAAIRASRRDDPPATVTPVTAPVASGDPCAAGCKLLATCGDFDQPNCAAECAARPEVASCFAELATSCRHVAVCAIELACHVRPSGTRTCFSLLQAHSRCVSDDRACRCADVAALAPEAAAAHAAYEACVDSCHGDAACPQTRCASQMQTCAVQ